MFNQPLSVTELINLLQNGSDQNPDAEWQAAVALGDMQAIADRQQALAALQTIFTAGRAHALTRSHAAESLGRLGEAAAAASLVNALGDSYRLVRSYAAGGLALIGSTDEHITRLLDLLQNDPFFGVRAEAAAAATTIALRRGDATSRAQVTAALTTQRASEIAQNPTGAIRVIAEIDRALARLTTA
jgi:HEAT repeat protein